MRNIKRKKIYVKKKSSFYKKIGILTFIFTTGIFVFNLDNLNFFKADSLQGLLGKEILLSQLDNIKSDTLTRPLNEVTYWSQVTDYKGTQFTSWEDLDDDLKTPFPKDILSIMSTYMYVSPYNIRSSITSPLEREKLLLYKRLITTSWTASYTCGTSSCDWWVPDTGTHAGVDLVSSLNTPVYSIGNGIVLQAKTPCPGSECSGFGNYVVIATNVDGEVYASFYAHLNSIANNLTEGDIVTQGEQIGYIGNTGNSTAPHLHFQVNILGKIDEIKNIDIATQLFQGRFNDLDGVKEKTIEPLAFIDSHIGTVGDDFTYNDSITIAINDNTNEDNDDTRTGLLDNADNTETLHASSSTKKFELVKVTSSKIDEKIKLGDQITLTVAAQGEAGEISVTTTNNVIKPSKYFLTSSLGLTQELILTANQVGNSEVILSDGTNKETFYYSVYNDDISEVYGLGIEGPNTIYSTSKSEFTIFPIDELGNKVNTSLQGTFTIKLQNKSSGKTEYTNEFTNDKLSDTITFKIQAPSLEKYKLKVYFKNDTKSLMLNKSLETDLFIDYSSSEEYANGIQYLYEKNIVQGYEGTLMPNKNISRADIVTILIRYKHGDSSEIFESEMNKYIEENGDFFSDLSGEERYAPYLYMGFADGIIKGSNGKALAEEAITKAELITIFGRNFEVATDSIYTSWLDIDENDRYKAYADAAKKYNLYPFEDKMYFNATDTVDRINTFESLYRYITVDKTNIEKITVTEPTTTSTEIVNSSTNTESTITKIINENNGTENNENTGDEDDLSSIVKSLINY